MAETARQGQNAELEGMTQEEFNSYLDRLDKDFVAANGGIENITQQALSVSGRQSLGEKMKTFADDKAKQSEAGSSKDASENGSVLEDENGKSSFRTLEKDGKFMAMGSNGETIEATSRDDLHKKIAQHYKSKGSDGVTPIAKMTVGKNYKGNRQEQMESFARVFIMEGVAVKGDVPQNPEFWQQLKKDYLKDENHTEKQWGVLVSQVPEEYRLTEKERAEQQKKEAAMAETKSQAGAEPVAQAQSETSQEKVNTLPSEKVTRLTQDKSLGEKMKLVAGFYAKKAGRAVDNSTPFQMAREVRDGWREFKGDMRDMGQAAREEWQQGKKRVRVGAKLAKRSVNNRLNAFGNAIRNSAPVQSFIGFKHDVDSLGRAMDQAVLDGVDWVRKAPGRAVGWAGRQVKSAGSWMGRQVRAAGSWLGNKIKSGAKKSWNWLKNTKAAKAVVKTTKAVTNAAVKTAMVVATPAILTYKGAKAVYDGGKNTYNKAKNWFNDKAELAARLEAVQNKPNEQVQEAAAENVHTDAVNESQTQKQTEQQKKAEEVVAEAVNLGDTRTAETAEQQNQSQTEPNQVEANGREKFNPLNEVDPATMMKIDKEHQKLEERVESMKKSGRPVDDKGLFGTFAQQLTSKDKNGFGLLAAQAEAYKQQYPDQFPKPEEQKKIDEATKKTEKSASQQAKQVENSTQPTARPQENSDTLANALTGGETKGKPNESILGNVGAKPKTDWMQKYDVENNKMFQDRMKAYKVKGLQGNEDAEFKYALGLEKMMTTSKEKGGLGINPKTPEGQEAIAGLKAQMFDKYKVKSFAPDKPKTQARELDANVAAKARGNALQNA